MFCTNCGVQNSDGARFCAGCGHAISATTQPLATHAAPAPAAPRAPSTKTLPTAAPPAPRPAPHHESSPRFDITQILTGDWLGSLTTALATLATAFGLSSLILALMHPNGTSAKGFASLAAMITASAFGGDFAITIDDSSGSGAITYGAYPLTITAVALIVAGRLFSASSVAIRTGPAGSPTRSARRSSSPRASSQRRPS